MVHGWLVEAEKTTEYEKEMKEFNETAEGKKYNRLQALAEKNARSVKFTTRMLRDAMKVVPLPPSDVIVLRDVRNARQFKTLKNKPPANHPVITLVRKNQKQSPPLPLHSCNKSNLLIMC